MENSYTDLIRRYCEGSLSEMEEKALFDQVTSSDEHQTKFREVEREWRDRHHPSFSARMAVSKARSRARRARMRNTFVAAASVAAALIAGAFVFKAQSPDISSGHWFDSAHTVCIKVPMSSTTEVSLPDGTKVTLNAGSELTYDKSFNKKNRNIRLVGEAYFDVCNNDNLPFVVNAKDCKITVLGTRFDVYAYEGEATYAALLDGSLRFDAGTSSMLVSPDELATFDGMSIIKTIVEADQYISWINGEITFDEIGLSEFLNRLSRLYDTPISYGRSSLDTRKFRAAFTRKDTIENILEAVSNLLPVKAEKSGDGYVVNEL